jgi:predicted nucleic acid-binding protein
MNAGEHIFVDSSAWIALADKGDAHHKKAAAAYLSILEEYRALITSNLVIAETYIVLLRELGHPAADSFLGLIKASPRIMKVYSTDEIEIEAERILSKYSDQDFSYTDAVSFSIMTKHRIKRAFGFDKHFMIAGFTNIP